MDNVVRLDTDWFGPLKTEDVIEGAQKAELENVLIIGWKDGDVVAFSDFSAKADCLWLVEKFKADLLSGRW